MKLNVSKKYIVFSTRCKKKLMINNVTFNRGLLFMEFGYMFSIIKSRVHIGARPGWVKQRQSGGNALYRAAHQNLPGQEGS